MSPNLDYLNLNSKGSTAQTKRRERERDVKKPVRVVDKDVKKTMRAMDIANSSPVHILP
ncbi:hypothetical protein MKW98_024989, partial [Papaver atlanticum]